MEKEQIKFKPIYNLATQKLIELEFKRLEGKTYLDHVGATLYSEKHICEVYKELQGNLFANPHARSTPSKLSEDNVDQMRLQILQHFNTNSEEYTVVFTSGATQALKIVAESFNYNNGELIYLENNHTSVLGMRELTDKSRTISHEDAIELFNKEEFICNGVAEGNSLFVYSGQCNFSGVKYPLSWIKKVQNGILNKYRNSNWFCMVDAASLASTNRLDLMKYKPDFLCVSFYKIFGFPSGLGVLLIRNKSGYVLEKKYFGGGTVFMALSSENTVVRRKNLNERFEDGTIPFLSIISLRHGFNTLKRLNLDMDVISQHTFSLAKYVFHNLNSLHHSNGNPCCILYHDTSFQDIRYQGGIVNFNLLRDDGSYIGYAEVMHICNLYNIYLRTGCFCNPGACKRHLQMKTEDVKYHFEKGHVCGDQNDLIEGKPTGSVRISFGYMSTKKDADEFLQMVQDCFITKPIKRIYTSNITSILFKDEIDSYEINKKIYNGNGTTFEKNESIINDKISELGTLDYIFIYPIKSCGAFQVKIPWNLVATGLEYDRGWMIVNDAGVCMTQKHEPRMCLIKPFIDLQKNLLIISCKGFKSISLPLVISANITCSTKICQTEINGVDCGDNIAKWLSVVLNLDGLRLLQQKASKNPNLSLVNKAQFLMINKTSVEWLKKCIPKNENNENISGLIQRFRPNFVFNFKNAFIENNCTKFSIGNNIFTFEENCTRCQMICIDQSTGEKSVEPLRTLSKEFKGKIAFGIYLKHIATSNHQSTICVGCDVLGI